VEDEVLCGEFAGPVPCGTAGGTGPHAATTKLFYRWMKVERAAHLEEVAAGIGLLQNLGALLSLVTEGIQKGHMRLHERKKAQPRN
jgi:hydroxymethylglutaryl-CoA reductase